MVATFRCKTVVVSREMHENGGLDFIYGIMNEFESNKKRRNFCFVRGIEGSSHTSSGAVPADA